MLAIPFFLFASALLPRPATSTAAQECLRYEPDTVEVAGRLTERTFYGPPGFGEDPKRDALEKGFYLELARAVCTMPGREAEDNPPKQGVTRVQLVLDSAGYARLRPSLDKVVIVRGTLFSAITGHHHAPLLLMVLKQTTAR